MDVTNVQLNEQVVVNGDVKLNAVNGSINRCFLDDAEFISEEQELVRLALLYDRMHKKLAYHFMNPIEKWNSKRRFPWKLCLQIVKVIVITWQMILFGLRNYGYVQRHQDMTLALGHILLPDWTAEVAAYPPSSGPYAVYTVPEFYENMNFVIKQYCNLSSMAVGTVSYDSVNGHIIPLHLCLTRYKGGIVSASNFTVNIDNAVNERCFSVLPKHCGEVNANVEDDFSIQDFLGNRNATIDFNMLIQAEIRLNIRTVFLKSVSRLDVPECYRLQLTVLYDNQNHDGEIRISLLIRPKILQCNVNIQAKQSTDNYHYMLRQILNSVIIVLCFSSILLCLRSLLSGHRLRREANDFFRCYFRKPLTFTEHLDFVDFWYVLMVISDILIVCGSIIKIQIEEHHHGGAIYNKCSLLLGVGNLFVWVGFLRYLGFFKKYNMLILTLKRALPNVLRFLLCAILLYAGFCFCGWIVLGPYHVKFQSLSRASECLFAVMNGDDMFATFALTNTDDRLIWWFSRFYLYSFLVLFIYVVISLFISVIMETFESIKRIYLYGAPPKTTVELFLSMSLPRPVGAPMTTTSSPSATMNREPKFLNNFKTFFVRILNRI